MSLSFRSSLVVALSIGSPPVAPGQDWRPGELEGKAILFSGQRVAPTAYDAVRQRLIAFPGYAIDGPFGGTWEFDGNTWRTLATFGAPPEMWAWGLVFDSVRGRIVLFGQRREPSVMETWELIGHNWHQVVTATAPEVNGYWPSLAFDPVRARTVLFGGLAGDETWEFDGAQWQRRSPATNPSPRTGAALAHDAVRGRTVLFGGTDRGVLRNDTWEWNGVDWTARAPAASPPPPPYFPQRAYSMVFDAAAGRVVAMNAASGLWEFDGTTWTQRPGAIPPVGDGALVYDDGAQAVTWVTVFDAIRMHRYSSTSASWTEVAQAAIPVFRNVECAAFDSARGRAVALWNGNETWEHDGLGWRRMPTPTPLPTRYLEAIAFDQNRGRTVVFGGQRVSVLSYWNDTWEWDGITWTTVPTAVAPTPRSGARMVHDVLRARTVLYGGASGPGGVLADTWEYDGVNWLPRVSQSPPGARGGHAMAFDLQRGKTVLYGGRIGTGPGDTWEWDGATWTAVATQQVPTATAGAAMTYDVARRRTILHGGTHQVFTSLVELDETWQYDGTDWQRLVTDSSPGARYSSTLVFDSARQRCMLVGGLSTGSQAYRRSTWYLVPRVGEAVTFGEGCLGSAGVPTLDVASGSLPALGTTCSLQLGNLPPSPGAALWWLGIDFARWNTLLLPAPLAPFGLPGCELNVGPAAGLALLLHAGATATVPLQIPNNPRLAGLRFGSQMLVLDAAAPNGLGAVTNGLTMRIW